MVQIEIELLPVVTGLSIGTVFFILQRVFSRHIAPNPAKVEDIDDGVLEPASPTVSEPAPEPGPASPAQSEFLSEKATKNKLENGHFKWAKVQFLLCLVLLTIFTVVQQVHPPNQAPVKEQEDSTAGLQQSDQQAEGESLQTLVRDSPPIEPLETEEDLKKAVTLNLTRQQTAAHVINGVVHYKSAYWGTIRVGTPAVDFKVVFDTGSGHLILPSAYCHSETCRAHKRYRRSQSQSARDINYDGASVKPGDPRDQITVSFGTGEVTGIFVEEQFCLHGSDDNAANLRSADSWSGCMPMRVILATKMSEEPFKTFHFDGVLGLGLQGLSQATEFNFPHMAAQAMRTSAGPHPHIFAVFLSEHATESSEITLGGYARQRMEGQLRWNRVLEPQHGHWMLEIKSVWIDDEPLAYCNEGCRAVIDTGTSLLAVPRPVFPEVFELLRHEADPTMECDGEGPKLHIELETFTVTLEPHDYSKPESQLPGAARREIKPLFPLAHANGSYMEPPREMCKPMLMSMSLGPPVGPKVFVLGEPVLRKYYTVYDSQEPHPRIGFARAMHPRDTPR